MTFGKNARVFFYFLIVLTEVAPWTIDLPEVRRFLFEKHEKMSKMSKNEYEDYLRGDKTFYSNIQGNSMHNSKDEHEDENYAQEFGYLSYMEKKVEEIVHDGSRYLEGLRRSLEDYTRFIEDCNRRNMSSSSNSTSSSSNSTWSPPMSPSSSNTSMSFGPSDSRFQDLGPSNWTSNQMWMNNTGMNMSGMDMSGMNMSGMNMSGTNSSNSGAGMTCAEAMETSENVRRYADLAMWATRRLQDIAYAEKYQKIDHKEEDELVLKLAWFLDRLAELTGYEPQYKSYEPYTTTSTSTSAPMAPTFVPQTPELTNFLINCVKANSSVPATVRCQYPLPLPDLVSQIVGAGSTQSPQSEDSVIPMSPSDSSAQQSQEILVTADDSRSPRRITKRSATPDEYYVPIAVPHEKHKPPIVDFIVKKLSNLKAIVKNVKKHAVADFASQVALQKQLHHHHHEIHKRSIDDTSAQVNQLSTESKPIVEFDNLVTENVPNIHLPVLDVSVISTKSFKKRSIDGGVYPNLVNGLSKRKSAGNVRKSVKKRFADDPLTKLANYYLKYKAWDGANPSHGKTNNIPSDFDVNNYLQLNKSKRSLFHKKHRHLISPKYLQSIHSDNYKHKKHSAKTSKGKLLSYAENMLQKKHQKFVKSPHKIIKRSVHYEHMYLPRISANPQGDISYYVKNKEGTDYNANLVQAALVRQNLQQIFETGNIEVVHRYGSNYNPANPAPFYTGILKSMADS